MRKIFTTKSVTLMAILMSQLLLLPTQLFAQSGGFTFTPILRRGDPVGDGGRFFDCDHCEGRVVGMYGFNNRGDVAIGADTSGSCVEGRFILTEGRVTRLADFCQPIPWGMYGFLSSVNLNNVGQATLLAGITRGSRVNAALFLYSDGQLTKIVEEGDPTPVGTFFRECGFSQGSINNLGDVAFHACSDNDQGIGRSGVFVYSGGEIRKVVTSGDPSPIGGKFNLFAFPALPVRLNDRGEILFPAIVVPEPFDEPREGLFLTTESGIKTINIDGDDLPGGRKVLEDTFSVGDLNNKSEVGFTVRISGGEPDKNEMGVYLYSDNQIRKVMAAGDPSPVGGSFVSLLDPKQNEDFLTPRINNNSAIAFKAYLKGGDTPSGIFLASPRAMLKVVAIGDRVPTGEEIREINTFALNDLGQVVFFAYAKKGENLPLGVYVAMPVAPSISKIKLKRKQGKLELRVNGSAMITGDTVIEINGVALDELSYPEGFRENGGTTRRTMSRDSRLDELIPVGQTVQITLFNRLTNRRSAAAAFTR
jgi:hypothetical protein